MRKFTSIVLTLFLLCFIVPAMAIAGKGFMGGKGKVVADEPPEDTGGSTGGDEGPLNDKKSDAGKLYGDLFKILRQSGGGGDFKLVPIVDSNGAPVVDETTGFQEFISVETTIGGEPVLTVIDPGGENNYADYGWYAKLNADETYELDQSPYPALCVQPVANYERWGDISEKTGLTKNRLPLVITYDPTWGRSECEVGQLQEVTVDSAGVLTLTVNPWFIEPGGSWTDGINGTVTYANGVPWTDLIEEVHFGRLNLSRAPEAVLQAAFDEAISTINSPDTVGVELDAAGRLLLTKNVYDELLVDGNGEPQLIGTIQKAIDSPLENVALYLKLMKDGHLVTPATERMPIDRSLHGGIPLWKLLELEDGPADASLRPTIDIKKMEALGLGSLVDVSATDYYAYYQCTDANGGAVECLCWNPDPVQPELDGEWVMCEGVVDRQLAAAAACPEDETCFGPFYGITVPTGGAPDAGDLSYAASFLAAGADKTGDISVDMVVYLNSILGINKVVGYSKYDEHGEPTGDAVSYEDNPVYFDFDAVVGYDRAATFGARGGGYVTVLQGQSPTWTETDVEIIKAEYGLGISVFNNIGKGSGGFPNQQPAADNILGFCQEADDDLSVIEFVHTYQIPGLR